MYFFRVKAISMQGILQAYACTMQVSIVPFARQSAVDQRVYVKQKYSLISARKITDDNHILYEIMHNSIVLQETVCDFQRTM